MTATNERTGTGRISPSRASKDGERSRQQRRHENAVFQAEVRRLARALGPYRGLQEDTLRPAAGAGSWHDVGFDIATEYWPGRRAAPVRRAAGHLLRT